MRIREYNSTDLDALRRMHAAQGFGYPFPDLDSPLFVSKLVLEDDDDTGAEPGREHRGDEGRELMDADSPLEDLSRATSSRAVSSRAASCRTSSRSASRVTMAILQRLTAETYLLHDPGAGTPRQRWQRFLALHDAARLHAAARGLDDVQAFLPPRIARAFGRRLARLGWTRDPWPCFSRRVP
ncbi:MAG: hypothetical protein ABSA96_18050 [Candidatus Acidiferrales bacterium]